MLMVEPGGEKVMVDGVKMPALEEGEEDREDVVEKELTFLDTPGWARLQLADGEVSNAMIALRPSSAGEEGRRYFGQDHDTLWFPGELELTEDEVRRVRRSMQEFEPCDVMAVAGRLPQL